MDASIDTAKGNRKDTEVLDHNEPTMTSNPLLEQEDTLPQQLAELSTRCRQHLTEAERDLDQTKLLLREAIEQLGASFMGIHAAIAGQQEEMARVLAGHALAPEAAARLDALRLELGKHVGAAVTGLQFQDMTSQLIERTRARLAGVMGVLDAALPQDDRTLSAAETAPEALAHRISTGLQQQGKRLAEMSQKSVAQTHMRSGDIELF
jgi:hypothetical protein